MNVTPGTLVFITLVVLIAGYLIFRPRKKKATEESERPAPSRDSSPAPTVSVLKENPRERLTDWLRKQKVANLSLDTHTTLATAMIEFSERVTVDNIVRGALQVGYSPSEVSTFMLSQGYELGEVAGVLVDEENLEVRELADIVMPLAQGSTVAERAEKTFEIVISETVFIDGVALVRTSAGVVEKFAVWKSIHEHGPYVIRLVPTGICTAVKITHEKTGHEFDLTDYESI